MESDWGFSVPKPAFGFRRTRRRHAHSFRVDFGQDKPAESDSNSSLATTKARSKAMRRPSTRHQDQPEQPSLAVAPLDHNVARAHAASTTDENRLAFARSFTFAAAQAYAATQQPSVSPLTAPDNLGLTLLSSDAHGAAIRLGSSLAGLQPQEAAYLLGRSYTNALPEDFRSQNGIYYTPPEIVKQALNMAERAGTDWKRARCLDPSAGGGAFLVEMVQRIRDALDGTTPALILRQIAARVRGYDLDPFGAWLAQTVVHFVLRDLERAAGRSLPTIVEVRDSLDVHTEDRQTFDLVASNVPFGRVTLSPERRAIYARSTYGHANLYGIFADASLVYAKRHGVLAFVTPTSMLSGLYFRSLRALLVKEAPPYEVTFVTQRAGVFDDALQETMLATYRKGRGARTREVHFLTIDNRGRAAITKAGTFSLPADPNAPWLLPRVEAHASLAKRLRAMKFRLSSYGYGVSTGPLVWNRHKPQFRNQQETDSLPVIWAEAVTSDGRFVWRAEKRSHLPWFAPKPEKDDWLIVDQACILLQRTTAKEQNRRLIAAELPESFVAKHGGVIIENHLNMIRARSDVPAVPPAVIAAFLNSRAGDIAFRCISGSVAVSAFELEELPLPSPATMRKITRLLDRRAPAIEIERVIAAAYGISDVAAPA